MNLNDIEEFQALLCRVKLLTFASFDSPVCRMSSETPDKLFTLLRKSLTDLHENIIRLEAVLQILDHFKEKDNLESGDE